MISLAASLLYILVSFRSGTTEAIYCTAPDTQQASQAALDAMFPPSDPKAQMRWMRANPKLTPPGIMASDHPNFGKAVNGYSYTDIAGATVTVVPCKPFL